MKIAIPSSTKGGLDDTIAPVFARSPVFTIVEVENGEIKDVRTIQNPAAGVPRGAGIMAMQTLINEGVDTIIAPQLGPNAMGAIQAAGIRVYTFQPGTPIREAVESVIKDGTSQITQSQLPAPASPVPPAPAYGPAHGFSYGWGRGRCWGRGFGRGRGRGRGRGWGARLGYCPWTGMPSRITLRWLYGWW